MKYAFTLGMRSTQLSESFNSDIKSCLKPDLDIMHFFKNFERVVDEKRYNELRCEFEARQKLPRLMLESYLMLHQLSKIYTRAIFQLFQKEFVLFAAAYIKDKNETESLFEYTVRLVDNDGEWRVKFDPNSKTISCSCRKFEMMGILCCHAAKMYDVMDVKELPEHYILRRWTREARNGVVHDCTGNEVHEDPKLQSTERYRILCMMLIRLATQASVYPTTFSLVHTAVCDLSTQVMKMRLTEKNTDKDISDTLLIEPFTTKAKGFKNRSGVKRSRRLKSWIELQSKRKKQIPKVKDHGTHIDLPISCSDPQVPHGFFQAVENQFNFTEFLMAPLDHPQYSIEAMDFSGDMSNVNTLSSLKH